MLIVSAIVQTSRNYEPECVVVRCDTASSLRQHTQHALAITSDVSQAHC